MLSINANSFICIALLKSSVWKNVSDNLHITSQSDESMTSAQQTFACRHHLSCESFLTDNWLWVASGSGSATERCDGVISGPDRSASSVWSVSSGTKSKAQSHPPQMLACSMKNSPRGFDSFRRCCHAPFALTLTASSWAPPQLCLDQQCDTTTLTSARVWAPEKEEKCDKFSIGALLAQWKRFF